MLWVATRMISNFTGMISGTASGDSNPAINGNVFNFAVSPTSIEYLLGTYFAQNDGGPVRDRAAAFLRTARSKAISSPRSPNPRR